MSVEFGKLCGIGTFLGGLLGLLICGVLSNFRADFHFYITYGVFGLMVGLLGSIVGSATLFFLKRSRRKDSETNKRKNKCESKA